MKKMIFFVLGVMMALSAHAAEVSCSADASVPRQTISGTCAAGRCRGALLPESVSVSGACSDNQPFSASAEFPGGELIAECNQGQLSGVASGMSLNFTGKCGTTGKFAGNSYLRFQYASGTCEENGRFNAAIVDMTTQVAGSCVTP